MSNVLTCDKEATPRFFRQIELALSEQILVERASNLLNKRKELHWKDLPDSLEFHFIQESMAVSPVTLDNFEGLCQNPQLDMATVRFRDVRVSAEAPSLARTLGPFFLHKMTYRGNSFYFTTRSGLGFEEVVTL